jgi:hypothetical protein
VRCSRVQSPPYLHVRRLPLVAIVGCGWRFGAISGHRSVMRRPGSQWDGAVERPSADQGFRVAPGLPSASHPGSTGPG